MLDVVFILLIFFIATSSFIHETGVEIARPKAASASKQQPTSILLALDAHNEIWIDGQRIPLAAVRAAVQRIQLENPRAGALIQADEAANSGLLVQVIDQIRLAGVEQIALSAQRQE
jgi:biopolymer transport protein ExbD